MKCPKCGYDNADEAIFCGLCNEIFRKEQPRFGNIPASAQSRIGGAEGGSNAGLGVNGAGLGDGAGMGVGAAAEAARQETGPEWKWCLISLIIALFITKSIYFIWYPFRFVEVFAHEMGHTVLYWLFGSFAMPAVNPLDTGGVAISVSYAPPVPFLVIAAILYAAFVLRESKTLVLAGVSLAVVYGMFAFTPAKEWLISAGGILAEYTLAGVCICTCLFKKSIKFKAERVLYGVLGWHALIETFKFLVKLKTDKEFYDVYINGSSWQAGITGDLAKIAFDINYRFSMNSFQTIVSVFLAIGLLLPVVIAGYAIFKTNRS